MYNSIKLEKGLYNLAGKNFLQALESLDPTEKYSDTPLFKLDAYERQLKRFDIKISGANCDTVDKFFTSTESAVLFPEFVKRAIKQGFDESILNDIVSVTSKTDSNIYRGYTVTSSTAFNTATEEGNALPETTIRESSNSITLSKYGRLITASYECIRQQRLDVFAVTLKSVGAKLANAITSQALTTLKADAASINIAGSTLSYSDIASLYGAFSDFDMTAVIASPATVASILSMTQMSDCCSSDYKRITMPFGASLIKSAQLDNTSIIGIDKNYALELITSSDLIMETDKMIDRQLDRITVSINVAFKKIMSDAVKVLKLS